MRATEQPVPDAPPAYDDIQSESSYLTSTMPQPVVAYPAQQYQQQHHAIQPIHSPYPQQPIFTPPQPILAQPVIIQEVSPYPQPLFCSRCNASTISQTEQTPSIAAWLACLGLAFIGCWPCCCIPFCIDGCMDVDHKCPRCGKYLARFQRV